MLHAGFLLIRPGRCMQDNSFGLCKLFSLSFGNVCCVASSVCCVVMKYSVLLRRVPCVRCERAEWPHFKPTTVEL